VPGLASTVSSPSVSFASPWRKCRTAGIEAVCSESSPPWAKPKATALRRSSFGEQLPRFEACHSLFEQGQATLDQVVFGFQALDGFHDACSSGCFFFSISPRAFYSASPAHGLGLRLHRGTFLQARPGFRRGRSPT
jgi:hypothetical protein